MTQESALEEEEEGGERENGHTLSTRAEEEKVEEVKRLCSDSSVDTRRLKVAMPANSSFQRASRLMVTTEPRSNVKTAEVELATSFS